MLNTNARKWQPEHEDRSSIFCGIPTKLSRRAWVVTSDVFVVRSPSLEREGVTLQVTFMQPPTNPPSCVSPSPSPDPDSGRTTYTGSTPTSWSATKRNKHTFNFLPANLPSDKHEHRLTTQQNKCFPRCPFFRKDTFPMSHHSHIWLQASCKPITWARHETRATYCKVTLRGRRFRTAKVDSTGTSSRLKTITSCAFKPKRHQSIFPCHRVMTRRVETVHPFKAPNWVHQDLVQSTRACC